MGWGLISNPAPLDQHADGGRADDGKVQGKYKEMGRPATPAAAPAPLDQTARRGWIGDGSGMKNSPPATPSQAGAKAKP